MTHLTHWCVAVFFCGRERAVQEMRRQGLSFSSLRSSSPLSTSLSPRPASPEHSILHTQEHSVDKIPEKWVLHRSCMSNIIYLQQRSVLVWYLWRAVSPLNKKCKKANYEFFSHYLSHLQMRVYILQFRLFISQNCEKRTCNCKFVGMFFFSFSWY